MLSIGPSPRPVSVAEPRRITGLNADAEGGVAHLVLPRLTACVSTRPCRRPVQIRPTGIGRPRLRLCVNASVIATMNAVRISARFVVAGYYHKDG
jgi:hypothetical protein